MKTIRRFMMTMLVAVVAVSFTALPGAADPPASTGNDSEIIRLPNKPPAPPAPAPKPTRQKGKRKPTGQQQVVAPNPNDDQGALEPPPIPEGENRAPVPMNISPGDNSASMSIAPRGPIIEIDGVNGNFTINVHEVDINNLQWTDMSSNHYDDYVPEGPVEMCLVGPPGTDWKKPATWIRGQYDPRTQDFKAHVTRAFKPGTDKSGDDDGQKFQVVARDGSARSGTPMGGWWKVDWESNVDWTDFSYHDTGGRISITADQSGRLSPTEGVPHTYQDALRWHGQRAQKYIP